MARKRDTPCAGNCGKLLWGGGSSLPSGQRMCRSCRADLPRQTKPPNATCTFCGKPFLSVRRSNGEWTKACSKKCNGHLQAIRDGKSAVRDQERRRAQGRALTHRRRTASRYSDITLEYEQRLRKKAKRCPMPGCDTLFVDQPYLPASKELDHIVPLNAGGTHTIGNVRIICRTCNQARPFDGSDYEGPVTLWSASVIAIRRPQRAPRTPRPKPTCQCGQVLTRGRCYTCDPAVYERQWDFIAASDMTIQERRSRALRAAEMREAGCAWWDIARELRFANASSVWHAVKSIDSRRVSSHSE